MGTLVLINGPAGVGKSTLARNFVETHAASVVISGDDLKRASSRRTERPVVVGLTFRLGGVLCREMLALGYEYVLFDFIFSRREHVDRFREALGPEVDEPHLVTLWASPEVLGRRRAGRREDPALRTLMDHSAERMRAHLHELGHVIDTDVHDPRRLLARIDALLSDRLAGRAD